VKWHSSLYHLSSMIEKSITHASYMVGIKVCQEKIYNIIGLYAYNFHTLTTIRYFLDGISGGAVGYFAHIIYFALNSYRLVLANPLSVCL